MLKALVFMSVGGLTLAIGYAEAFLALVDVFPG